ncbi:hypothetical protein BZA05DRAFT_474175 [Tricharina praecox]|uniref:uncharacterized protein n=1 Tax=Tricharina praecox TaxID=43433 RepID=UPI0022209CB0|nr:uncharacterized protein BZA05DRAFT_474175 [Tricharina praecox]KAI5850836.1 hypothetical protein BZA05DRAFT_474175 [Tricharina praecox]
MQVSTLILSILIAALLAAQVLAAPVPKNVFRPENYGMGYRGRKTSGPRNYQPFPGAFGRILGPDDAEPRVDRVDKVDCVDKVDSWLYLMNE